MENIFSELASVRAEYERHKSEYDDLTKTAIEISEDYISSMQWCNSTIGKNIYMYQSSGLSTEEICTLLKMNENTYRSNLSRISARLRKDVFETNNLYETLLFSANETKQNLISRIKFLKINYNFFKELSPETVTMLLDSADTVCIQDSDCTEKDLIQALVFIKMLSHDYYQKQLRSIKSGALKAVISGLRTNQYNSFVENYLNTEIPLFISNANWIQYLAKKQNRHMLEKGEELPNEG